jgi:hypothetical protein
VNNIVHIISTIPFQEVKDLLNFLQVVDQTLYSNASNFFNTIGGTHKAVNDYFRENQFDNNLVTGLMVYFIPKMIDWAGKQKSALCTKDDSGNTIPTAYASRLQQMITNGKYKRALKPLTENNISYIRLSAVKNSSAMITINESNLGDYLPEEEKILPELENGSTHNFSGEILALQSTRGETLKFKIFGIDSRFQLLTAHPEDNKKTEDYKDYYKKQVNIKAEIFRKTLYKKPEIIIRGIVLRQIELFNSEE